MKQTGKVNCLKKSFFFFSLFCLLSCFVWTQEKNEVQDYRAATADLAIISNHCQDDLKGSLLNAIKSAQKSILVLIYSLNDKQVIDALNQKSKEGVSVTVIYDAKASMHLERKMDPRIKLQRRFGKGLMHLKIMVIDQTQIWMGSANFTHESLALHGNLVFALEHPALAELIRVKAASMEEMENTKTIGHEDFKINGQKISFWFLPDDRQASKYIKKLIRSAQTSIRVAMFTFTRYDFAKELLEAQMRGVTLEIAMDHGSSKGANARVVKIFKDAKFPLICNKGPGLLHHKFLYIDEKILVNGSANWTKAAFNSNDDCFLVVHDLSKVQVQKLNQLWKAIRFNSKEPEAYQ